jgi:drug/metabolite transporter (DMT)-like permease
MAAYLLIVRQAMTQNIIHPLALSGGAALVGGLMLLGVGALSGARLVPSSLEEAAVVLGVAALPQLVGHGLMTWATRHLSPTEVGLATLGEPIGAAILASLLLDEGLGAMTVAGGGLTLFSLSLALTRKR